MDKVRLGRVLGKATRLAARTAAEAAEAAMAADPRRPSGSASGGKNGQAERPGGEAARAQAVNGNAGERWVPEGAAQRAEEGGAQRTTTGSAAGSRAAGTARAAGAVRQTRTSVQAGVQGFRKRTGHPFRQASRELWLEVTGSFFALFAAAFAVAAWQFRASWQDGDRIRLPSAVLLAGLFGWFCVSSFLRARRRR